MSAPTQSADTQQRIAELRTTRPYDGRRVTLRESRAVWKWTGIRGICLHIAADYRLMVLVVEHDPEDYWPVGAEIFGRTRRGVLPGVRRSRGKLT